MVGLPPAPGDLAWRDSLRPLLKDADSLQGFAHPASYMFKNLPSERFADDPPRAVLEAMDRYGVTRALIGVAPDDDTAVRALRTHPDRFLGAVSVDPNAGTAGIRALRRAVEDLGVRAAAALPAGGLPPRSVDDPVWFPVYATCIDLGIPFMPCMGVPGPRIPFAPQHVMGLDRVCFEFPELVVVTRHGCEPWEALMVKLMVKWPNLHYSTSAFAPKHYPRHRRVRQHPGRRPGLLRRVLPHGPLLRADLRAAAGGRLPGPRLAPVPARERRADLRALTRRADPAVPEPNPGSPTGAG